MVGAKEEGKVVEGVAENVDFGHDHREEREDGNDLKRVIGVTVQFSIQSLLRIGPSLLDKARRGPPF